MVLFVGSLALRAVICAWVVAHDVPPLYDEAVYFDLATAWAEVYSSLANLSPPSPDSLMRAYGQGHWPPLHPMVLGVAVWGWPAVAAARWVGVLASALTTLLVFLVAQKMAGARAAWGAAWVHLVSPTFLFYAHSVWSENLAMLLVLIGLWLLVVEGGDGRPRHPGPRRALAGGAVLALAVLTRAAVLPLAVVLVGWMVLATSGTLARRCRDAGLSLLAMLAVIAPWQGVLQQVEGSPAPVLTTLGGWNWALGNHPRVPDDYGSSWGHEASKAWLIGELRAAGDDAGRPWQRMAAPLAHQEIARRPLAALERSVVRGWLLFAPDAFLPRHLLHAVYPPLPHELAGVVVALGIAGSWLLIVTLVAGLLGGRWRAESYRWLLVAMVLGGMAAPMMTVATTRLHLPLVAVGLPAIGLALTTRLERRFFAVGAALLVGLLCAAALPRVAALYWIPSSYYAPRVDAAGGSRPMVYSDAVEIERYAAPSPDLPPEDLLIEVMGNGSRFADGSRRFVLPAARARATLVVHTTTGQAGYEAPWLEVRTRDGAVVARLEITDAAGWRQRRPIGDAETALATWSWRGGGPSPH